MRLRHRIQHALRKPPHLIAWKIRQRALQRARTGSYWDRLDQRLRAELGGWSDADLERRVLLAPQPLSVDGLGMVRKLLSPEQAASVLTDADDLFALRFSHLGWTREFTGLPLPWTTDWKTGREWPLRHHTLLKYWRSSNGSDVKSCWEPSRFHFAVRLGQAFRLTGDSRFVARFTELFQDWVGANPLARSINWTSPLEVAIRAVNLSAGLVLSMPALAPPQRRRILEILAIHGAFIHRNVEYTDIRGNHFTGNLLGLLVVGALLRELVQEAEQWFDYAGTHIPREILLQFSEDGVNHEKTLAYHSFVTEMFLLGSLVLQRAGEPLRGHVTERLRAAALFTAAYLRPDGTAPVIGDNDNARALPLSPHPPSHQGHLLPLARVLLGPCEGLGGGDDSEAIWIMGARPPEAEVLRGSRSFGEGGFFVGRVADHHMVVDAGHVGLQGGGCHGHHDMLSFDLSLFGRPVVVDPGSPAYTGDLVLRNRFRRTASHNTAVVDGTEQGTLNEELIWQLGAEAVPERVHVAIEEGRFHFQGAHLGYTRLPEPVIHNRTLELHEDGVNGKDFFHGKGAHRLAIFFHLRSGLVPEIGDRWVKIEGGRSSLRLSWCVSESADAVEVEVVPDAVSPGYGELEDSWTVVLRRFGLLPWSIDWEIQKQ